MKDAIVQFRVPAEDKEAMKAIARGFGEDLSSWARRAVYMEMQKAKTLSDAFEKAKERMGR